MAEDNNTGAVTEVIATAAPAEQPAAKKQRAPRGSKISKETTGASTAPAAKSDVAKRGKRAEKKFTAVAKIAESAPKYTGKRRGRKPAGAQVQQASELPNFAVNEMADLLQLEEENAKLRKMLSEKLRQENAGLRKRLGLET